MSMLHLILAAALMADGPAEAAPAPVATPVPPSAPSSPPDLRIGLADLAGCTALVNTMVAASPESSPQLPTLRALGLNWSLVFDTAQSQSQKGLRPAYDKARGEYQTQIANATSDETLGMVILGRLNEGMARCETIRASNAAFFNFVLDDFLVAERARQAAASSPAPAQP
jgi:hypothetical protein